jgi:hypothetical protein
MKETEELTVINSAMQITTYIKQYNQYEHTPVVNFATSTIYIHVCIAKVAGYYLPFRKTASIKFNGFHKPQSSFFDKAIKNIKNQTHIIYSSMQVSVLVAPPTMKMSLVMLPERKAK